ncbi:MAG: hypothetical protein GF410_16185 [Chitinivibrionales bacterium]|nr:hypothetical protein [Chitinivibrionales bacterium]
MHPIRTVFFFCLCAATLVCVSCIQRDNPFDPANYSPNVLDSAEVEEIRDTANATLDSSFALAVQGFEAIDSLLSALVLDSAANDSLDSLNQLTRSENLSRRAENDTTAAYNDTVSMVDSLRFKLHLDTLLWLVTSDSSAALDAARSVIRVEKLRADSQMSAVNKQYLPDTIYTDTLRDSILAPFDSLLALCDSARAARARFDAAVIDTNTLAVVPYNETVGLYNDSVAAYNDSILFARESGGYPPIEDGDSLQQSLFAAQPGDTFVVASDTFTVALRFSNSGSESSPIVVIGQPDLSTVLDSVDVAFSTNSHIIFKNIVFSRGSHGARLVAGSGPITFENCSFVGNGGHGCEVVDSDARFRNCRMLHNGGHGLRVSSAEPKDNRVELTNTLIAHNRLTGIGIVSVNVTLQNTTISDNGSHGIRLDDPELELAIYNSLISYNGGYGITFLSGFNNNQPFTITSSVLYGNVTGQLFGNFQPPVSYLGYEPVYVDADADNYNIAPGNRLYDLEQEGIVIGYRDD